MNNTLSPYFWCLNVSTHQQSLRDSGDLWLRWQFPWVPSWGRCASSCFACCCPTSSRCFLAHEGWRMKRLGCVRVELESTVSSYLPVYPPISFICFCIDFPVLGAVPLISGWYFTPIVGLLSQLIKHPWPAPPSGWNKSHEYHHEISGPRSHEITMNIIIKSPFFSPLNCIKSHESPFNHHDIPLNHH